MHTLNHIYSDDKLLLKWIKESSLETQDNVMIQFFSGIDTKEHMQYIASFLTKHLPHAHIIGTTTDGEIDGDNINSNKTLISASVFQKSKIYSNFALYKESSEMLGKEIASKLDKKDTKVMILFSGGLDLNGESFMNGVQTISQDKYIIAGGMAGDNGKFKATYVSYQDRVLEKGSVGVVIEGDDLVVKNSYHFGWEAIGLPMKITKCEGNRVYEINNLSVIDIYKKYFGENISELLPKIGVEIPLMVKRDGQNTARAPIFKYDDGSLVFAGTLHEGEDVRFAIGNAEDILRDSERMCHSICEEHIPETVFVYSCMARRRLLGSQSSLELHTMAQNTTVSGFFTYGEFYSDMYHNHLLNETMTLLTLSERPFSQNNIAPKSCLYDIGHADKRMLYAITHMTNVIAKEWQDRVDTEILKNKEQERQGFQKNKLVQMGEMISMIAHQWRQPLNAISASSINLSLLASMDMLEDQKVQESSDFIQEQCQKMSSTIDTFMNFVKPSKESRAFKLSHTLDAIMQIMGTQLINHNIKVNIAVADDKISLVGYEDLLEQVIINILSNARDAFSIYNGYEKYINISVKMDYNIPLICIEDNAGGIPKDIQEKIFNPYFTTKEQGKGTGIGLYMSIDIIRKSFNGDIKYHGIQGGSRFEIRCGGGEIV